MSRIRVAVLGATGVAGQQFLAALPNHPLFEVVKLGASERSAGKKYGDAIRDAGGKVSWFAGKPLVENFAKMNVEDAAHMTADGVDLVFTAVESDAAKVLEPRFAEKVPVVSTASAFRYEPDVPVFLPAVNLDHAKLIEVQRKRRGWKGFVTPGPNCTTVGLAITLKPLETAFGIDKVVMTSMQSVSGAGRSPGVLALDIIDNVVPYIAKEEEKVEKETKKILGSFSGDGIADAKIAVSCTCTRVNVIEGHTESVFVGLKKKAGVDEVKAAMREFGSDFVALGLPSTPQHLITVSEDPYRPQPRLDRDNEDGMTTTVGRVREEPVLGGVKYMLVSHNTRMGAAKGAMLIAEYLVHVGYIGK
ncbi:MAG TPA: aspartate-semialdehyde dehydrogenase [Polyangia bacterium]|nr:aspartate-semialdehyde dehydrogenase [Polyangia bacterium]